MIKPELTYWIVIILGYTWAAVQFFASEPFDALILFLVTFSFQTFRDAIVREIKERTNG